MVVKMNESYLLRIWNTDKAGNKITNLPLITNGKMLRRSIKGLQRAAVLSQRGNSMAISSRKHAQMLSREAFKPLLATFPRLIRSFSSEAKSPGVC
jgi:hypothetical protein